MIRVRCRKLWAVDGGRAGVVRLSQFIQQETERVRCKLRAMKSCRRQSTQSIGDGPSRYLARCYDRAASQALRQHGGASDRRGAAAAQKARFDDCAFLNANRQFQNIAANRIRRSHLGGGVRQLTGVARIPKVLQDQFVEHRTIVA
jgi:hypothetical protein